MKPLPTTSSADRVLLVLKTKGPQTAAELAKKLEMTPMGARQHLYALASEGLVEYEDRRARVGRPARFWRVSEKAASRFPDSHAELTVGLIAAMRHAFGKGAIPRLVNARTLDQVQAYRARLPGPEAPLERRIAELTEIRHQEGYMAQWSREPGGSYLLVENHCPICAAARACQELCGGELTLFQRVLGPDVTIERTEHILAGARRCTYRITDRRTGRGR
jgi:predicted ArsR family transcriptional regulator